MVAASCYCEITNVSMDRFASLAITDTADSATGFEKMRNLLAPKKDHPIIEKIFYSELKTVNITVF